MPIYSIEGNIGSGKSTLVEILKTTLGDNIIFIQEPVDEWNKIQDDGKTILEAYYEDQLKFSFSFQMMAYISRLAKLRKVKKENPNKIIITERSLFTDKNVFCKMLYDQKFINNYDYQIYNMWFNEFIDDIQFDGVIYVDTDPNTCFKRVNKRDRIGEDKIKLSFLEDCHKYHSEWLDDCKNILTINGSQEFESDIYRINKMTSEIKSFVTREQKVICE
jgi:deoxyadenosine/deoxycytidine kinase